MQIIFVDRLESRWKPLYFVSCIIGVAKFSDIVKDLRFEDKDKDLKSKDKDKDFSRELQRRMAYLLTYQ